MNDEQISRVVFRAGENILQAIHGTTNRMLMKMAQDAGFRPWNQRSPLEKQIHWEMKSADIPFNTVAKRRAWLAKAAESKPIEWPNCGHVDLDECGSLPPHEYHLAHNLECDCECENC